MLNKEIEEILSASKGSGWVIEPEAKRLLALAGLDLTRFKWATKVQDAVYFASEIGYPVVAKIVSSKVIHKSDVGGVVTGIGDDIKLKSALRPVASPLIVQPLSH